ncbi:MAG: hypothetical protein IJV41_13370 [Oscillospiraceae bacterium]|nr:hypothetical protein [Oscillospiraceae bacterium]
MADYKVHVGFGFHVNCYHSYRGDTNDALGFGGDIRIIRHILDTLDDRNRRGIPVRGTWDFENAYSLEKILPAYAPDIIERVKARGDENILMGYNNGAMSAMTEDEFQASIAWAVSNPYGSGLKDIFGACEMIIRPQEVMFTPSQVHAYRRAGVKAICLYYSCISFDAFRTLIPQLKDEYAFNPLRYTWEGESLTVLPTYSPNDVMDAGSLRALVTELHEKQRRGEIQNDVFLFLNTDADSFLWEPMAIPAPLQKLPCFGGIGGYIDEISDLDFVVFDTPGGYLKTHTPVHEITFGQDVADGNLSGYMSWSEKPFNRLIWTRLERARAMAALGERDADSPSFETRLRLLSTTHFGLASPVMNVTREEKARELSEAMLTQERSVLPAGGHLRLRGIGPTGLACVQLELEDGFVRDVSELRLESRGLDCWCACETGRHPGGCVRSVYLVAHYTRRRGSYVLQVTRGSAGAARRGDIAAGGLSFNAEARSLSLNGKAVLQLDSWIEYDGKTYGFDRPRVEPLALAGEGAGLRLTAPIHLPGEQAGGSYVFDFFTTPAVDCVFVRTAVQYPYTTEDHEISSQASNLGRYSDTKWLQTAPFELTLCSDDTVGVTKRSFAGALSSYRMADFWRAFPLNRNIASINHQLTGGTLAVAGERGGILIAHARQVLGSMAHCPLRLRSEGETRYVGINPFGTYFGPQRYYPRRGNGSSMEIYEAAAPQARSLAPAYNGAFEQSVQALFGLSGAAPTAAQQRQAEAVADGVVAVGGGAVRPFAGDNVRLHDPVDNKVEAKDLKSVTFVEQCGGLLPLLGIVKRYAQNLVRAERNRKNIEKRAE